MAGAGTGFGQANIMQTINSTEANSRAERQQAFKDRQIKIMETEQVKQQQSESGAEELVQTVQAQQAELTKMKKKQSGTVTTVAMTNVATAAGGPNVGADFVKQVNANTDLQETLKVQPNQMTAFDANSRADNDAFLRYLDKNGVDYTAWSPEYTQQVKDSYANSGLMYNFMGDVIDGSPLIQASGAMNMVGTDGTNVFEGKKANLGAMLEGEEGYGKWVEEQSKDPEKRTWFQDYVDKLPKSEREAILARKKELGKMTNKEAAADLQVTDDLKTTDTPIDTTKNVDGSKANLPETVDMGEPIYDGDGAQIATKSVAPDGKTVTVGEDGTTASTEDGTVVTRNEQGGGTATQADGTTTTFDGEQSVTVSPTGVVTSDYVLPKSVQMAYDMLGMKSSFSEDANLNREVVQTNIAKAKDKNQTFEQYLTSELKAGKIDNAEYMTQMEEYQATKQKDTDWQFFYKDWEAKPENAGRSMADARRDYKAGGSGSNRALTTTEEFRNSSSWLANNRDKKGSARYREHETVVRKYNNELRTATMKDNEATAQTVKDVAALPTQEAFNEGKASAKGIAVDSRVRADPKLFTPQVRKRETEAVDTAQSVANLADLGKKLTTGVKSGKYKSGYLDSAANWMQSKVGADFITNATSGEIGAELKSQYGIEGELAIELGRVVKAAYGGNASNEDRKTIAGAMAGLSSEDEKVRLLAFNNFQRTMHKLNAMNIRYFNSQGLYRTSENLSDTANTVFDKSGHINESKPTVTKPPVSKGGYRFEWENGRYVNKGKI